MAVTNKEAVVAEDAISARGRAPNPRTGREIKVKGARGGRFVEFARLFRAAGPMQQVEVIRKGVNSNLVIEASWYFETKSADIGRLLGMSPSTTERRLKTGKTLTPMESERLARLALLETEAVEVFGSEEKAKRWLTKDHSKLGATPLSMLDTEVGANEVRKILMAIAYGMAA